MITQMNNSVTKNLILIRQILTLNNANAMDNLSVLLVNKAL